jgi:hypothetical protein
MASGIRGTLAHWWGPSIITGRGAEWPQTMAGQLGELVGRLAIFIDGAPSPSVTSFAPSKALFRSVDETKAQDITIAGGTSLNDGIFLVAAVVDKALKGSMVGERMNKAFGREVWGRG